MSIISSPALPKDLVEGVYSGIQTGSTVGSLVAAKPQGISDKDIVTLATRPKAEIVGAGANKSNSGGSLGSVSLKTHKAQVTVRFDQEVLWADEEKQIGIMEEFRDAIALAVARQIDLMAFHGVSALAGNSVASQVNYAAQTTKSVELAAGKFDEAFLAGIGLLISGGAPNCAALNPDFAFGLGTQTNAVGGTINPTVGFGEGVYSVKGLKGATSTTVSGVEELTADSKIKGFLFDANNLVYGINEVIPMKVIEFGDPDGQGDLQRKNQIALRSEVLFSAGWVDLSRVAKIVDAVA